MDSKFILDRLENKFAHNKMSIKESFVYMEESDFLTITRKNLAHEIEVKISRGDYRADFKKRKHLYFQAMRDKESMITIPGKEINATCSIGHILRRYQLGRPMFKQRELVWSCSVWFSKVSPKIFPNKFSFAVPEGLIAKDEVPEYAGLYYVTSTGSIKEVKRAKMLHREEFDRWETVALKFYWKLRML